MFESPPSASECHGAQPGKEHEILNALAGRWRAEVRLWMDPTGDPQVAHGTMTNTLRLNGLFLEEDYQDDSGMYSGRGYFGFNQVDRCYEGLWLDVMTSQFQLERGQHDPATNEYHMSGDMTHPRSGRPLHKRSVVRVVAPDEHVMESYMRPADGEECKVMEIRYTRA